ncbi:hypothetical protein ABZ922_17675 [Streptomyces shenzhenensis]|uniref:hypothetical protein n=1 Tax=Streptomyces shenzhenensis TaxID=943815 RepID=UPI003402AD59
MRSQITLASIAHVVSEEGTMERDISGDLLVKQSNGSKVNLHVNEDRASGALIVAASFDGSSGTGDGVIRGDELAFTIDWHNGSKGHYEGHFGPDNVLTGRTFDMQRPDSRAYWFVDGKTFPRS